MAKIQKEVSEALVTKADTCEIIELAINDIETLAKAFNLIADYGEVKENLNLSLEPAPEKIFLN